MPKLVRAAGHDGVSADVPDTIILNRFRNIISCSSKLPPVWDSPWTFFLPCTHCLVTYTRWSHRAWQPLPTPSFNIVRLTWRNVRESTTVRSGSRGEVGGDESETTGGGDDEFQSRDV